MEEYTFSGKFSKDFTQIDLESSGLFRRALYYLEDVVLEIRVRKLSRKRTDAQNRYWWGVIIQAVIKYALERKGETIDKNDAHLWILTQILDAKFEAKTVMGKEIFISNIPSTSEMSTKQFADAVDKVRLYFDNPELGDMNLNWPIALPTKFNLYHEFSNAA